MRKKSRSTRSSPATSSSTRSTRRSSDEISINTSGEEATVSSGYVVKIRYVGPGASHLMIEADAAHLFYLQKFHQRPLKCGNLEISIEKAP